MILRISYGQTKINLNDISTTSHWNFTLRSIQTMINHEVIILIIQFGKNIETQLYESLILLEHFKNLTGILLAMSSMSSCSISTSRTSRYSKRVNLSMKSIEVDVILLPRIESLSKLNNASDDSNLMDSSVMREFNRRLENRQRKFKKNSKKLFESPTKNYEWIKNNHLLSWVNRLMHVVVMSPVNVWSTCNPINDDELRRGRTCMACWSLKRV